MDLHWVTIVVIILTLLIILKFIIKKPREKPKSKNSIERRNTGFSQIPSRNRDSDSLMSKYINDKSGVDDLYDVLSRDKYYLMNKRSLTDESFIAYMDRKNARESNSFDESFVRDRFVDDYVGGREPFLFGDDE